MDRIEGHWPHINLPFRRTPEQAAVHSATQILREQRETHRPTILDRLSNIRLTQVQQVLCIATMIGAVGAGLIAADHMTDGALHERMADFSTSQRLP